ncbi:MAG: PLP-dependent aminotransferase family protein [Acidobacteriota bacterium]
MSKSATALPVTFALSSESPIPLYRQLYDWLRKAILSGQLQAGTRLQSTRELAAELGVSRNTVLNAFEQLLAEGYLEGQVGAGTFVSHSLPDDMLFTTQKKSKVVAVSKRGRALSDFGAKLTKPLASDALSNQATVKPFRHGTPALAEFPKKIWANLLTKHWRKPPLELLTYNDAAGYSPLREAIADYLRASRAVRCEPEQVIIIAGAQQGLDISARLLLNAEDTAWIEDPGYLGARSALISTGAKLVPVPVDDEGFDVNEAIKLSAKAKLVYVSPSHQYPLGVTMSLTRRLALLEWASRAGAWIIEDDYDSEYRYAGRPLAALQGLDKEGRVIYIGTFSKVLFPALRIGYVVAPPDLIDAFTRLRNIQSRFTPSIDQAVVADFINEGHFHRHLRRMRMLYRERQEILLDAIQRNLNGLIEAQSHDAGMHVIGWLQGGLSDQSVENFIAKAGIYAQSLSSLCLRYPRPAGLLMGYAGYNEKQLRAAVRKLAELLSRANKPQSVRKSN